MVHIIEWRKDSISWNVLGDKIKMLGVSWKGKPFCMVWGLGISRVNDANVIILTYFALLLQYNINPIYRINYY